MKTAEEVLRANWIDSRTNPQWNSIVKAMESYVQERTKDMYPKEFVEWLFSDKKTVVFNHKT